MAFDVQTHEFQFKVIIKVSMKELIDAQKAQKSLKNYGFLMFRTCEFQLKIIPKLRETT